MTPKISDVKIACSMWSDVQGDTKNGNFWKPQQKLKKCNKKILLTKT